jgi:cysteine desulfurase
MKRSEVLAAMDVPVEIADGAIRVSFGRGTSESDVDRFLTEWRGIAERTSTRAA